MASILTENVRELVKQLIHNISGFDETSEHYNTIEDFAFTHIASPDYYFTYNKKDIEKTVDNLGEKFRFHGFLEQSDAIIMLSKKFFDASTTRDDQEIRVAIMKFLLNISHSPTKKFTENPELYKPKVFEAEEITDWGVFLNETKAQVIQSFSDTTDETWSELSDSPSDSFSFESEIKFDEVDAVHTYKEPIKESSKLSLQDEAKTAKEELLRSVQASWWNKENVSIVPTSKCDESRVALEWENFVNEVTMGLISQKANIVPEYKIMRELIWQFFETNSCFSFGFEDGKFIPKSGISIGSVRPHTFQYFLHEFVPYFEILKAFRNFQKNLNGEYFIASIPDSYRSYSEAVQEILEPVYKKIRIIENVIRKQEQPMTILTVASELKSLFKNLECLYYVHTEITNYFNDDSSYKNSTYLLSRLYYGLLNSSNKNEQNLYLTLYLKSLYKYFTVIEIWLSQDILDDSTDEFVIIDKNSNIHYEDKEWQVEYVVRDLDPISRMDGMLNIICTKILQLAKNIHLLRLLGKLHLITSEFGYFKASLHDEFVNKVLEEAVNYTKETMDAEEQMNIVTKEIRDDSSDKLTVICPEQNTSKTGMDSTENFLDFSDGFLATVFESYLYQQKDLEQKSKFESETKSLFETINEKITKMFPAKQILERTFLDVLNSRYSVPGMMVKNMLINQFELKKHFQLIKYLFLFEDDIIFPFYKTMFQKFESQQAWGNFFLLTSQLQDLLMDLYPESYEFCRVDVEPNWRLCTNPIAACELVTVHCKINWPVNIIITPEHVAKYHEVFQFILKLKWAMNTLNRLPFAGIEPRSKPFKSQPKLMKHRIRKLQSMRFFLLNDVSSMQHYVLGHLFSGVWKKFDKDLEDSYDLESIIKAHDKFIKRIHSFCIKLRDEMSDLYGFRKILTLIFQLQEMWNDINDIDDEVLNFCEVEYRKCHKFLRPIIEIEVTTF